MFKASALFLWSKILYKRLFFGSKWVFLTLFIFSCQVRELKEYRDSEVFCPFVGGLRVMVYDTSPEEIIESIENHIKKKIKEHTNENYTIIRTKTGSTVILRDLAPEEAINCRVYKVLHSHSRKYVR